MSGSVIPKVNHSLLLGGKGGGSTYPTGFAIINFFFYYKKSINNTKLTSLTAALLYFQLLYSSNPQIPHITILYCPTIYAFVYLPASFCIAIKLSLATVILPPHLNYSN